MSDGEKNIWDNWKQQDAKGLPCPVCKCKMSYVIDTRKMYNSVTRIRKCRACGKQWRTREN